MMIFSRRILPLVTALFVLGALTGCDQSEQNIGWEAGDSRGIAGPDAISIPDTAEYYVQAYTIDQNYTWSVDTPEGVTNLGARRDGEYIDIAYSSATPDGSITTITVDDGTHTGELQVTAAVDEDALGQADRYYGTLASAVGLAGITNALAVDLEEDETVPEGERITLLAPRDAAFLAAFDADAEGEEGYGELNDGELPSPGVLAAVLQYHVLDEDVASGDITDGQNVATLSGADVTFSVSNGSVSVEGAEVVNTDIPAVNGTVHAIDQVLEPPFAAVDLPDQAAVDAVDENDDPVQTVTVGGVYLPEGGFVVLHDGDSSADPEVSSASDYLEPGYHNSITLELNAEVDSEVEYSAVVYEDSNDDEQFSGIDAAYQWDGADVVDTGTIEPPVQ